MEQATGALDVTKKPRAESGALGGAGNEARDVRQDEGPLSADSNHTEVGGERREGIVRDLRLCCGEAGDESGFSNVRESEQADVREQLELQPDLPLHPCGALRGLSRRPVPGGLETKVPRAAATSLGNDYPHAIVVEIGDRVTALGIEYERAHGHDDLPMLTVSAVAIGALSVQTSLCFDDRLIAVLEQGVHRPVGADDDVSTMPSVTSARTATGGVLLSSEGDAPVSAVPRSNLDLYFIDKLHEYLSDRRWYLFPYDSSTGSALTAQWPR